MSERTVPGGGAADVAELAAALGAAVRSAIDRGKGHGDGAILPEPAAANGDMVNRARKYLKARRRRETLFPADLFGEPAWDILLSLYVAQAERRPVSISSACIAAAVPSTTALRWIGKLEASGLVVRRPDSQDHRFTWLTLTPGVSERVEQWLEVTFKSEH